MVAISVDIEKAYDIVWRHGLLEKIYKLGIRGPMFSFIDTFIHGRSFRVNVGGGGAPSPQLLIWKMRFPRALALLQY